MFFYSHYWKTWSRRLGICRGIVEVNLTPTHPDWRISWDEQVIPIIIRRHNTPTNEGDRLVAKLPYAVYNDMMENIEDKQLIIRLLKEDFLPQIDWKLFRKYDNGGAEFRKIRSR